jgi:tRNA G37 N-methylase Trm5
MNYKNLLNILAKEIQKTRSSSHKTWVISLWKEQVTIKPAKYVTLGDIILIELSDDDRQNGLTSQAWQKLEYLLRINCEHGLITNNKILNYEIPD